MRKLRKRKKRCSYKNKMNKKTKFNRDSNKISQLIKKHRLKILTKAIVIHNKVKQK